MQRKKFPFLVTPPHILPPDKPSFKILNIEFLFYNFYFYNFYKSYSKHGPDVKKNYFVFSIIDEGQPPLVTKLHTTKMLLSC